MDMEIIASMLGGVDIAEVYSPQRVAATFKRFRMSAGSSMDLRIGWDFTREVDRRKAWKQLDEEKAYLLVGAPPCKLFSTLQAMNISVNKGNQGWREEFESRMGEAREYITLRCSLYRKQLKEGRHFLHRHPWTATS